ncbi:hypothetical protein Emed_006517 [Eimeria media]
MSVQKQAYPVEDCLAQPNLDRRVLRLQPGTKNADIVAFPSDGLVHASATTEITIRLYASAPGEIRSTCRVIISGLETPFDLQLYACASGPKLKVDPKELQWGKISCLDEVSRQLEVTNVSPIPATFRCSLKGRHEYFVTPSSQLTLQGGASTTVEVTAIFTEAVTVVDQLVITVLDGQDTIVTLKGQAVGSPVVVTSFDGSIDFQQVEIEAFSLLPGRASQVIICQESLGASATPLRIARTVATADFFTPALLAKPSPVVFQHVWKPGDEAQVLRESLVLTNSSPIDLKCKAKTASPFVVEPQYFSIKSHSTATLAISFDATFNGKQSAQVNKPLEISFQEHPKTEVIPLEATAEFPDIDLESTLLDFGFVANETTKRISLRIKNNGSVPVSYGWYLSDNFFCKPIEGRASRPHLKISETEFDFGEVPYLKALTADVHLINFGLVDLSYAIDVGRVKMPWTIAVSEQKGIVRASEKLKVEIKFMPGETGLSAEAEPPSTTWKSQAEVDRQNLCKIMLDFYRAAFGKSHLPAEFAGIVATPGRYVLDFGSVVVGQAKTKLVQLRNVSLQAFGFKVHKKPNEQFAIALTAKHDSEGTTSFPLTLAVSGGIAYEILLKATFVIPDLQVSTDRLDFGRVRTGLRKTMTLRLRNEKSVPAHWRHRTVVEKGDKAQSDGIKCFVIEPKQAEVLPGGWLDVKIHFYPARAEREVCARIVLCLDDNPKWKCILATGAPAAPCLEFVPPVVELGHCLPSHTLRREILVRNNSGERCELYSLELDDQYKKTIDLLRNYDGFDEAGIALLPVRQSAIILGPSFCGKCRVAKHLGCELRRVLTLEDCVEWALAAAGRKKKMAAAGADVAREVGELIRFLETQEGDGDYLWGKRSPAKTRAAKGDRQGVGSGLPLHLLIAAVKLRVAQPDCYAGTVFWVEPSLYCPSASDAGLAIARALPDEDLMIVTIKFGQLEGTLQEGEPSSNPCADGVAYYRALMAKNLQRERELVELLDGKGQESTTPPKTGASPSGSDSKKKKQLGGVEAETRVATTHLLDGDVENLKEELLSLQHTRQQVEANLSSSKAAQAYVQEQIATYCAAESELINESRAEKNCPEAPANFSGSLRRPSHRQSFRGIRRTIAFSTAYLKPATSTEALLAQIQPLREPVIPTEPPFPEPELVEVVSYPSSPPKTAQPTTLVLLSPLGSAFDKIEDEDSKCKLKKTRDATSPGTTKQKLRQEKGGEDEGLAVRLAVEPGYIKATRWILEPHDEQRILLKFSAEEEGDYRYELQFGVLGDAEIFRLEAKATCCLPKLASFPQGCFEYSTEERLDKQTLKKTYVIKEGFYEWGPLLAGRSAALIKSLYSKGGAGEDVESVSIPPELQDFMTPLLLRNASPFDTLVKGSFAGGLGLEGGVLPCIARLSQNMSAPLTNRD